MKELNWKGIDLNLLLTFDALFQFGSVSAASKYLHLGQPATSYNLKRLRELLDDPLFERHGNRMQPTSRAVEIAPKVQEILAIFTQDILPSEQFNPSEYEGKFSIGVSDYAEQIFGPNIFDALQAHAPNAKVLFKPADNENCVDLLENHNTDICIGVFNAMPSNVESTFLYREKHLCTFDNSVLKTELPIPLTTYLATPQMIITANDQLTSQVDNTLASLGVVRNVVLGTTRFLTIRRMLSGRKHLAVMAEMVGRSELIHDQLTLCPPPIDIPDFDIEMVTLKRDSKHPKVVWLSTLVRQLIQQQVNESRQISTYD
ncbi:LysR family transcriptional regulator [Vibrio sp. SCSIO 43135]|uniref:LysR substrate-binding domain-containing protein n=1 Tax=Vibrio paucivorans TaxID=2829489 RepID=A0A9X3CHU4_9VIBR|nr:MULTISPECIES: LysR substrate-binding domain-containing protein [Vibrio]MCW8336122.1 LysR substrate-binding domain-containing protein [Vibrio paucivorans]USD43075.1 LysR family transcriptional regulator [Vibrio sp. SCSIO 43135]